MCDLQASRPGRARPPVGMTQMAASRPPAQNPTKPGAQPHNHSQRTEEEDQSPNWARGGLGSSSRGLAALRTVAWRWRQSPDGTPAGLAGGTTGLSATK